MCKTESLVVATEIRISEQVKQNMLKPKSHQLEENGAVMCIITECIKLD